ncbi:MAG: HD domain-containing phosphohydrolase [Solirubrobacteraceae bacterium]
MPITLCAATAFPEGVAATYSFEAASHMTEFAHMHLLLVHGAGPGREAVQDVLAQAGYTDVVTTADPARTLELCVTERPDLVLLDFDIPDSSHRALDAVRHLTHGADSLQVLAISAHATPDVRRWALANGVRDFVAAPVDDTEFLVRVHNALQTRHLQRQLRDRNAVLREAVRERTGEVDTARESLSILAAIADYHDDDSYQHAQRVGLAAYLIAQALDLDEQFVATIRDAAPLHDIGKVGISRRILLKPDKLTPAEWMHMMRHVEIGARILASARSPVLRMASEIAGTHHERWDGNGYVAGLVGAEIPLAGRITALADVWDTLTHERPYKAAWDADRALSEIDAQAGSHFDPRIVEAFHTIDRRLLDMPLTDDLALRVA